MHSIHYTYLILAIIKNAVKEYMSDAPCLDYCLVINGLTCSGKLSNNLINDSFVGP